MKRLCGLFETEVLRMKNLWFSLEENTIPETFEACYDFISDRCDSNLSQEQIKELTEKVFYNK